MTRHYSEEEQTRLLDRLAIRELLEKYFHGMGTRNFEEITSVFTSDVQFAGTSGLEGVRKSLQRIVEFPSLVMLSGAPNIQVDGDSATADTQAVAFRVQRSAEGSSDMQVVVVGIHYFDRLVRTPEGWRISERRSRANPQHVHDTPWQFAATPTQLDLPG